MNFITKDRRLCIHLASQDIQPETNFKRVGIENILDVYASKVDDLIFRE